MIQIAQNGELILHQSFPIRFLYLVLKICFVDHLYCNALLGELIDTAVNGSKLSWTKYVIFDYGEIFLNFLVE